MNAHKANNKENRQIKIDREPIKDVQSIKLLSVKELKDARGGHRGHIILHCILPPDNPDSGRGSK